MIKKYGKWALYAFIAYQVVGLVILFLNFESIITESQNIAYNLIGEK